MSGKTKIEWADRVWNPVMGCTPVSTGCAHCYAKRIYERFYQGRKFESVQLHPERLEDPLHWKQPAKVFVNSMSDLFNEDVPDDFIGKVWHTMVTCNRHNYLVLTKRPERMKSWIDKFCLPYVFSNIWLGVTVENQEMADQRIPVLLETPAAVRFVSVEPMLGQVRLRKYLYLDLEGSLDWVICGGETGTGARPIHPDWVRYLRDQCQAEKVPFFFKSWGEWVSEFPQELSLANRSQRFIEGKTFYHVGKAKAGRLIDGREWNEFPEEAE